jgi:hypothetical protein
MLSEQMINNDPYLTQGMIMLHEQACLMEVEVSKTWIGTQIQDISMNH